MSPNKSSKLTRYAFWLLVLCFFAFPAYASTTITGAPAGSVVGSYTAPTAGDFVTGNSIQVPVQGLANDVATLRKTRFGLVGGPTNLDGDSNIVTGELDLGSGTAVSLLGVANNGSGLIRITYPTLFVALHEGDVISVSGVGGTTEANDTWVVAAATATTADLYGSAFVHTWTSGGTFTRRPQVAYASVSRVVTRKLRATWNDGPLPIPTPTRGWSIVGGAPDVWVATNGSPTSSSQIIYWAIGADIAPEGAQLDSVNVYYQPAGGHSSSGLPHTFPVATAYKLCFNQTAAGTVTGATSTVLGTTTDSAANVGAYEVFRTLNVTLGTAEPLDYYHCLYTVAFATETGTAALQGTSVYGADATFATRNEAQY